MTDDGPNHCSHCGALPSAMLICGPCHATLANEGTERLRAENAQLSKTAYDEAGRSHLAAEANVALRTRVEALGALLRKHEWLTHPTSTQLYCAFCYAWEYQGHHQDCGLDAALAAPGAQTDKVER